MDHHELQERMLRAARALTTAIDAYRQAGIDFATAKRDYSVALSKELVRLRAEGTPATLSETLAKGEEQVSELRFLKDKSYGLWRAAQAHITVLTSQVDIARSLLVWEREERFENPIPGGG